MHQHGTMQAANRCARFCAANEADKEYYRKHRHYREVPTAGCLACKDLKDKVEAKRREDKSRARAASKCVAAGENPVHHNGHLCAGMERRPSARH